MRRLAYALAPACYGHENHIVVALEGGIADAGAYEAAAEGDVGRAQLLVLVELAGGENGVVCIDEAIGFAQVEQFVDLSGEDEAVASHDEFVCRYRIYKLMVETLYGRDDNVICLQIVFPAQFLYCHADGRMI